MVINNLLKERNMSQYKLSKLSGVSQSTISDICNGKILLARCSGETLKKLSKSLNTSIDILLSQEEAEISNKQEQRASFDNFKSSTCHAVKNKGDIVFVTEVLERDSIRKLYNKKWYPECFYLLAMVDYLSRINNLSICSNYNDIRKYKLAKPIYPSSIIAKSVVFQSEEIKLKAKQAAIPEFMRFNIVECEVRDVV